MKIRLSVVLGIIGLIILVNSSFSLGEEQAENNPSGVAAGQERNDSDIQWVWGEVTNIDPQDKTVTVRYLDYETDKEKELTLGINESTTYENVKSLEEIQPKDTLSVDYIMVDGKNTAKNISLEKPETEAVVSSKPEAGTVSAPAATGDIQPSAATLPAVSTPEVGAVLPPAAPTDIQPPAQTVAPVNPQTVVSQPSVSGAEKTETSSQTPQANQ